MSFRNLNIAEGRIMAVLGECILGAEAAKKLSASVGSSVISSPAGAFDIAGSFPLKMTVTGILAPSGTSDDDAVFTDIKTSWVISGKAHGHEDITRVEKDRLLENNDSSIIVASAAVLSYTEITDENRDSFHFHGDPGTFPVDAILAVPESRQQSLKIRSALESTPTVQAIVPRTVIDGLIETLFSINNLLILGGILIGTAAFAIATLVFVLSIRLRKRELVTLQKMGVSPGSIRSLFTMEIIITLGGSAVFCSLLLLGLSLIENNWLEQWLF
jgi:putative ABC transport system permease protein